MAVNITAHMQVPKHSKVSESDKEKLLKEYHVSLQSLPKIMKTDPGIAHLNTKPGDLIMIERESKTAGIAFYYRVVME